RLAGAGSFSPCGGGVGWGRMRNTPVPVAAPLRSSSMSRYADDRGPYSYDPRPYDPDRPRPHSGLGLTSFVIGLLVIVLDLLLVLVLVIVANSSQPRMGFRTHPMDTWGPIALLFNCVVLLACFTGGGLGVAALFQEDRNRTFAVIGVILNGVVILI